MNDHLAEVTPQMNTNSLKDAKEKSWGLDRQVESTLPRWDMLTPDNRAKKDRNPKRTVDITRDYKLIEVWARQEGKLYDTGENAAEKMIVGTLIGTKLDPIAALRRLETNVVDELAESHDYLEGPIKLVNRALKVLEFPRAYWARGVLALGIAANNQFGEAVAPGLKAVLTTVGLPEGMEPAVRTVGTVMMGIAAPECARMAREIYLGLESRINRSTDIGAKLKELKV